MLGRVMRYLKRAGWNVSRNRGIKDPCKLPRKMICTKRHRGRERGLCQTDGTPCCVFDWKRKVTFAATSKRQWSAKQIGLRSAAVLEQTLLQGTARLYFTIVLRAPSGGRWPLPPCEASRSLCWKRLRRALQRNPQTISARVFWAFFPPFFSACFISPGHLHVVASIFQLVDQVLGQKGWGGDARRAEEEAASCCCHSASVAWQGCGAPPPLVGALLSWQPDSASVKTRYRNVLWVTFKTRYKSSALWDCSAINYLA